MLTSFVHVNMLLLTPLFIHIGFVTAFWLAVYPTTFIFTESLVTYQYLPAFYSAAAGLGEIARHIFDMFGQKIRGRNWAEFLVRLQAAIWILDEALNAINPVVFE
ncbi:unnamed protein product [Nippostrongylus brasiliensis]|uniref:MBOAT_2 domain-containing protein n=1 Tax=Nippostrongylus brasiliensis TaxID=27835 RepID=A0A0N4YAK1_NIPBR|nr:unnamed protein product [Nippostrongylus brasiliensis]